MLKLYSCSKDHEGVWHGSEYAPCDQIYSNGVVELVYNSLMLLHEALHGTPDEQIVLVEGRQ